MAPLPPLHEAVSSPDRCPGVGSLIRCKRAFGAPLERPALSGRCTGRGDFAIDGPDEARELACDRGNDHGCKLALPAQCSVARAEPALCLPGDLADRSGGGECSDRRGARRVDYSADE